MRFSIRRQLLLWLAPILFPSRLGVALVIYYHVHEEIDELFDKVLQTMAYSLQPGTAPVPVSPKPQERFPPEVPDLDLVTQIWSLEDQLRYRSDSGPPLSFQNRPGWSTIRWQGKPWRVFCLKTPDAWIQVAQSQNERRETANEIASNLLLPLLVLVPALLLLIWFSIGRGLLPLREIARSVERRSPDSLQPIPDESLPDEIRTLANALNGLLQRLGEALKSQREFTADAALELSTPLTALSLKAQVAEGASTPEKQAAALKALRRGNCRVNHLLEQLLTLARLDPESLRSPLVPQRLDELARQVVAENVPLAAEKNIDLGIVRSESALIQGDPHGLRVLLGNLIDNAIRYSPPGGRINVDISTDANAVLLEVTDTGPLAVLTACTDYVARPLEPEATAAAFEASQLALQLEVAKQYPDFQLGPGLLFNQGEYKWMLGLTLTLRILNQNEGPIAEAEARRREAAVRFEALQARIISEVERTAAGAREALDKFRAAEEMLETRKRQEQDTEALVNAGESDRLAPVAGRVATRTSDLARFDALIRAQQVIAQLEDALQRSLEDNRADLPIPAGTLQLELGNR